MSDQDTGRSERDPDVEMQTLEQRGEHQRHPTTGPSGQTAAPPVDGPRVSASRNAQAVPVADQHACSANRQHVHRPHIVVAIGMYYAFARYGLVGTPFGLVLAHTCLAVPFVVTSVGASLAVLDPRLEQAALNLGATPWGAFRQVKLPLVGSGILVGALFAFLTSFDELIVALFLSGSGAVTLPRRMWDEVRFAIDPTIAAVSTLTIALSVVLLGGAHLLRRRAERLRQV